MRSIIAVFKYEFKRIFGDRKQILYLSLMFFISFYCFKNSVDDYKRMLLHKKLFKNYEIKKASQFVTYTQYGSYGFRVFFQPSPLMIFFNGSSILDGVESNVDTQEVIKMNYSYKGQDLFRPKGGYRDFAGVLGLLGSLFMLFMGMKSVVSTREVKFWAERKGFKKYLFNSLFARSIILAIIFSFFFIIFYTLALWAGIQFSSTEKTTYFVYNFYTICLLLVFFYLGVLIKVSVKFRGYVYVTGILVWFCLIYVLPELQSSYSFKKSLLIPSNSEMDLKKLSNLMEFERSYINRRQPILKLSAKKRKAIYKRAALDFMSNYYLLNKNIELNLHRNVKSLINNNEMMAVFAPTCFYNYLSGELSSKGYGSYLEFVDYIMKLREKFLKFYINKKFDSNTKFVESFVKGEENIYKANVKVPDKIFLSMGIIFIYIFVFIHIAYIKLKKQVYR